MENIGKASARSVVGFDIGSVIIAATQEKILLERWGSQNGWRIFKKKEILKILKILY